MTLASELIAVRDLARGESVGYGGTFVAERDSLVTKCPSKFTKDEQTS